MMKRVLLSALCLLLTASLLASCSAGPEAAPGEASPAAEAAPTEETAPAEPATPAVPEPEKEEEAPAPAEDGEITGGASAAEAAPLGFNTRYHGRLGEDDAWFAFTTGGEEDTPYTVTAENLTADGKPILGYLYDASDVMQLPTEKHNSNGDGRCIEAGRDGTANSGLFRELAPNATYFLRLEGEDRTEFSLRITGPGGAPFDASAGRKTLGAGETYELATNMDASPLLAMNARFAAKIDGGFAWFAFTTGVEEDTPYTVTAENLTADGKPILGYLYDEFGVMQLPTEKQNSNGDGRCIEATWDGTANSSLFRELEPNATYFLRLQCDGKADCVVCFSDPVGAPAVTAGENVTPGTSQSYSLLTPLNTRVSAKTDGGYAWLAFTTTEQEGAEYWVSVVNCTVGSKPLIGYLVDSKGVTQIPTDKGNSNGDGRCVEATWDGTANSSLFRELAPNTTYFLRLRGEGKTDYTMTVFAPGLTTDAYATSSSAAEARGAIGEGETFYTGTNQNDATLLKLNVTYRGDYRDGYAWMAFTTTEQEGAEYTVTVEDLTVGSKPIIGYLYNEYGRCVFPTEKHNSNGDGRCVEAREDGTANSSTFAELAPNTTYYIRLQCDSAAEYLITIGAQVPEEGGNTIEEAVLPVPFELNETQVRFVGDEAIFVDEAEARAALAPVAEIILAHPGHPILLAGTTATGGPIDFNIDLSDRRAAAVKDLLVREYGVPAEQLLTVGLGYDADPFVRGRDLDENGNQIETEAAKNRRVVVLDAESEIARKILGA